MRSGIARISADVQRPRIGWLLPVLCRFLGRRHDEVIHGLWRPASEKRQGTKSREVGGGGAADAMGIWPRGEA